MKKSLVASYWDGVKDFSHGESYTTIFRYFMPEAVTAFVLYSVLYLIDAKLIADLKSTSTYATLSVTNTVLHFIVKVAEGFSVGTLVLSGRYNGVGRYEEAGKTLSDAFWVTCIVGGIISIGLASGAYWIYLWYGVPEKMISLGIPFLRLRALGIFFMFLYFAFVGFLRGVKNTRLPMVMFSIGACVFVLCDYLLIHGNHGFPALGLQGSAIASVAQYGVMLILALFWVLFNPTYAKYRISLLQAVSSWSNLQRLCALSGPIVLDKAIMSGSYVWLGGILSHMGKYAIASYAVIKDMERFALVPAIAFAQVVTLLVTNAYGTGDWKGIKSNIKKGVFLASLMVSTILIVFSLTPATFIAFFDIKGRFTDFAARAFPILSILAFFDAIQVVLSGALRGASNVRFVMMTRLIVVVGYFVPISYLLSQLPIRDEVIKFSLVYGSFYVGSGLMSIVYINRFRGRNWQGAERVA